MLIEFIQAVTTITVPLLVLIIPGILFVKHAASINSLVRASAKTILWSISILTLASLIVTSAKLNILSTLLIPLALFLYFFTTYRLHFPDRKTIYKAASFLLLIIVIFAAFSVPFLISHDGLPTGDSQKSILWAQNILDHNSLPDYSSSASLLNRDPVDFYTPGLHTLTALIMKLSPHPLMSIGFFAISLSIAAAIIGSAISATIFNHKKYTFIILLTPLFILTNERFLRYLREPGYHLQNIAGELLLFGLIFISLSLLQRWRWRDFVLAILTTITLFVTHQFSAFLAAFLLLPIIGTFIFKHRSNLIEKIKSNRNFSFISAFLFLCAIVFGFSLELHQKLPHIFTSQPHLLSLSPSLLDYPKLMGAFWLFAGISGLILMLVLFIKNKKLATANFYTTNAYVLFSFITSTLVLLILSQAPRLNIDIPPIRTLFFTAIPLSITAAFFANELIKLIKQLPSSLYKIASFLVLIMFFAFYATSSVSNAFTLSHSIRTNSTLTYEQLPLIDYLKNEPGNAVLTDDYNKRSSSWLVLSGKATFARISADLKRQMNEAKQSNKRYQLYLKQLDFEKIFSLGNRPEIIELLNKHSINWITGIQEHTVISFAFNPLLSRTRGSGSINIFSTPTSTSSSAYKKTNTTRWLLRPSTLANDIGDREDTFKHLPASLRTTRLSKPTYNGEQTYRITSAPLIPLYFNVNDYVRILWDKENTGKPDTSVELLVHISTPLTIETPTGQTFPLPANAQLLKLPASTVPLDDDGYIKITILNPEQKEVAIDLIALGLARTP